MNDRESLFRLRRMLERDEIILIVIILLFDQILQDLK